MQQTQKQMRAANARLVWFGGEMAFLLTSGFTETSLFKACLNSGQSFWCPSDRTLYLTVVWTD